MDGLSTQNTSEINGEQRNNKGVGSPDAIKRAKYPILEYDDFPASITQVKKDIYPTKKIRRCIITYFQDVVAKLESSYKIFPAFRLRIEGARPEIFELQVEDISIYVLLCPLGAPQAARMLEIMSAIGVDKFIVCGGAGTLDSSITGDKILLPTVAIRDEGTSYHYLPPAREVKIDEKVHRVITNVLKEEGVEFLEVKTWTTDASFRETPDKVALRQKEGAMTVEMECSAYYSVAQFKKLHCGQLLYAGDIVKKEGWDYRDWHSKNDVRERLFDIAVKCVMKL